MQDSSLNKHLPRSAKDLRLKLPDNAWVLPFIYPAPGICQFNSLIHLEMFPDKFCKGSVRVWEIVHDVCACVCECVRVCGCVVREGSAKKRGGSEGGRERFICFIILSEQEINSAMSQSSKCACTLNQGLKQWRTHFRLLTSWAVFNVGDEFL